MLNMVIFDYQQKVVQSIKAWAIDTQNESKEEEEGEAEQQDRS
jgi:hypothetical protein